MGDLKADEQLKQLKDFAINFNRLSQYCFNDCIFDFTKRELSDKESHCADNCMERYLKMNQRISKRFEEFQSMAIEKAQEIQNVNLNPS